MQRMPCRLSSIDLVSTLDRPYCPRKTKNGDLLNCLRERSLHSIDCVDELGQTRDWKNPRLCIARVLRVVYVSLRYKGIAGRRSILQLPFWKPIASSISNSILKSALPWFCSPDRHLDNLFEVIESLSFSKPYSNVRALGTECANIRMLTPNFNYALTDRKNGLFRGTITTIFSEPGARLLGLVLSLTLVTLPSERVSEKSIM